jgi:hypothetical protein
MPMLLLQLDIILIRLVRQLRNRLSPLLYKLFLKLLSQPTTYASSASTESTGWVKHRLRVKPLIGGLLAMEDLSLCERGHE